MIARQSPPTSIRPRMVVAYADSVHAALSARHFRRLGWEVHLASSGPDARQLTRNLGPEVVILDTQLPDESGWLTCAKLMLGEGAQKVVLVSPDATDEEQRLADAVGAAALVSRETGVPALVGEVMGMALPHAG
jgi:DNA-binding response OmpR family regulator